MHPPCLTPPFIVGVCRIDLTYSSDGTLQGGHYTSAALGLDIAFENDLSSYAITVASPPFSITGDGKMSHYTDSTGFSFSAPYPQAVNGRKMLQNASPQGDACSDLVDTVVLMYTLTLDAATADPEIPEVARAFGGLFAGLLGVIFDAICKAADQNASSGAVGYYLCLVGIAANPRSAIFFGLCLAAQALSGNFG